jgi:endonuclease/exonuclease/phosphatase family metal-dependent hydrolase
VAAGAGHPSARRIGARGGYDEGLAMRFVVYNIRYGTGAGWRFHVPFPFSGYLRPSHENTDKISKFLRSLSPDIVGLIEVDNGSYRSRKRSQAQTIADGLGFSHVYESKYGLESFAQNLPVMRQQGNAFLTNQSIHATGFHYFQHGIKRLVIELELEDCVIYLVHLSIKYRHRQYQLGDLHAMFSHVKKPKLVAGDFNAFWGHRELSLFMAATGLVNANIEGRPTFPSLAPRRQLDFILHSPEIRVQSFEVPKVSFSDHMPLVCDFEVDRAAAR